MTAAAIEVSLPPATNGNPSGGSRTRARSATRKPGEPEGTRGSARSPESGGASPSGKRHRTREELTALFTRISEVSATETDIEKQAAAVGLTVGVLYVYRAKAKAAGFAVAKVVNRKAGDGVSRAPTFERNRRMWTAEEDQRLRLLWGDVGLRGISLRLKRSREAVYHHAYDLGLKLGLQQGMETINDAAKRTGFCWITMSRILKWAGVERIRTMSDPGSSGKQHVSAVDPDDVDEAVAKWMATEPVWPAAARRGIAGITLARWLADSGQELPPRPRNKLWWRVSTEVIDKVVADHRSVETVSQAARRVGVGAAFLARSLVAAGVPRSKGQYWKVNQSDVDRVVATMTPRQWSYVNRRKPATEAAA